MSNLKPASIIAGFLNCGNWIWELIWDFEIIEADYKSVLAINLCTTRVLIILLIATIPITIISSEK